MALKNILLPVFTGIFFYASLPVSGMEQGLASKALAAVNQHKGKLALAGSLFAGYQLYKKYQKEFQYLIKDFQDFINDPPKNFNKDTAFWMSAVLLWHALIPTMQLYLTFKKYKFLDNQHIATKVLARLLINISTQLPIILWGLKNNSEYRKKFFDSNYVYKPNSYITTPISVPSSMPNVIFSLGLINAYLFFVDELQPSGITFLDNLNEKYLEAIDNDDYHITKFYSYIAGTNFCDGPYSVLPVVRALQNSKFQAAKALLERYNCRVPEEYIEECIRDGHFERLRFLVEKHYPIDPNITIDNMPAIMWVALKGWRSDMVHLLISIGADVGACDANGDNIYDILRNGPGRLSNEIRDILNLYKKRYRSQVSQAVDDASGLIPDLANMVAGYVV